MTKTTKYTDNLSKIHKNSAKICRIEMFFVPLQRFSMGGERIIGNWDLRLENGDLRFEIGEWMWRYREKIDTKRYDY